MIAEICMIYSNATTKINESFLSHPTAIYESPLKERLKF